MLGVIGAVMELTCSAKKIPGHVQSLFTDGASPPRIRSLSIGAYLASERAHHAGEDRRAAYLAGDASAALDTRSTKSRVTDQREMELSSLGSRLPRRSAGQGERGNRGANR